MVSPNHGVSPDHGKVRRDDLSPNKFLVRGLSTTYFGEAGVNGWLMVVKYCTAAMIATGAVTSS